MMLDFKRDALDTFFPYFYNFKGFMVKFRKILFKSGRLRVGVCYELILKLVDDKIQQRKTKKT